MKKVAGILGAAVIGVSVTSFATTEKTSFSTVNVILGQIENTLPEGCKIERKDPVVISRSPVKVIYSYTLTKGNKSSEISFEQSQNDFTIESDDMTFESLSNADNSFYLRLDASQKVQVIKVNDLVCKK